MRDRCLRERFRDKRGPVFSIQHLHIAAHGKDAQPTFIHFTNSRSPHDRNAGRSSAAISGMHYLSPVIGRKAGTIEESGDSRSFLNKIPEHAEQVIGLPMVRLPVISCHAADASVAQFGPLRASSSAYCRGWHRATSRLDLNAAARKGAERGFVSMLMFKRIPLALADRVYEQ